MRAPDRTWLLFLALVVATLVGFTVIWAVAPEDVRGLLLIVGGIVAAAAYVVAYAVERRHHG